MEIQTQTMTLLTDIRAEFKRQMEQQGWETCPNRNFRRKLDADRWAIVNMQANSKGHDLATCMPSIGLYFDRWYDLDEEILRGRKSRAKQYAQVRHHYEHFFKDDLPAEEYAFWDVDAAKISRWCDRAEATLTLVAAKYPNARAALEEWAEYVDLNKNVRGWFTATTIAGAISLGDFDKAEAMIAKTFGFWTERNKTAPEEAASYLVELERAKKILCREQKASAH